MVVKEIEEGEVSVCDIAGGTVEESLVGVSGMESRSAEEGEIAELGLRNEVLNEVSMPWGRGAETTERDEACSTVESYDDSE